MATKLGLYELLAPQFAARALFPPAIDAYMSLLGVEELRATYDDAAIVYVGVVKLGGGAGAAPRMVHHDSSGAVFDTDDIEFGFRLTLPRGNGDPILVGAANNLSAAAGANPGWPVPAGQTQQTQNMCFLLTTLGAGPDGTRVDFRLELMLRNVRFGLTSAWRPAVYQGHRVVADAADPNGLVFIYLPEVVFEYEQRPGFTGVQFNVRSWGGGWDATDLRAGTVARMQPPLAIHSSGRVAFGLERLVVDFSVDSTPPEIAERFGIGDDWRGVYLENLCVFVSDTVKDFDLTLTVRDALISFTGELTLEVALDAVRPDAMATRVLLYDGDVLVPAGQGVPKSVDSDVQEGMGIVPPGVWVLVAIDGGTPGFTVAVKLGNDAVAWDATNHRAKLPDNVTSGDHLLRVEITDSSKPALKQIHKIRLRIEAPKQLPAPAQTQTPAKWTRAPGGGADDVFVLHTPAASGEVETLTIVAPRRLHPGGLHVTVGDDSHPALPGFDHVPLTSPRLQLAVPLGGKLKLRVDADEVKVGTIEYFHLYLAYERPTEQEPGVWVDYADDFKAHPERDDYHWRYSGAPRSAGLLPYPGAVLSEQSPPSLPFTLGGAAALRSWINFRLDKKGTLKLEAYASYEGHPDKYDYNLALSQRRLDLVCDVFASFAAEFPALVVTKGVAHGHALARDNQPIHSDGVDGVYPTPVATTKDRQSCEDDRVVTVRATLGQLGAGYLEGTLERAGQAVAVPKQPKAVPFRPGTRSPPELVRRLGVRLRIERDRFILFEFTGELDFETVLEQSLRSGADGQPIGGQSEPDGHFLQGDGVVEFTASVTQDPATDYWTERLRLHSAGDDDDAHGLFRVANPAGSPHERWKDAMGAMMLLAPILAKGTGDADLTQAGDLVTMTASWLLPAAVGGLGVLQTREMVLYGGELKLRQYVPGNGVNAVFCDQGVIFDYGVSFEIHIDLLNIHSSKPLRVRYKAVGFNAHVSVVNGNPEYQPIFDPSAGYEIDLSDPALFDVGDVAGDLLRVVGARIGRFNPLTLELDLAFNLDLGVVKFDEFKVKWPIVDDNGQGPGMPMILPAGAQVKVPGALIGAGRIHMLENGFEGSLDLTLVPIKTRVAASLAVREETDPQTQKKYTAVFAGMSLTFPSPIVLGTTGLGIYGFAGLFAMHYKRVEDPAVPGDPIGPALGWLKKADGQPEKFSNALWQPALGRWTFGVGAILGSLDGGFLTSLRGMFMLELPGPRILVCVQMKIVQERPDGYKGGDLTAGLLGVLDIDVGMGRVTLGVIADLDIESLVQFKLPIELFFDWKNPADWHLYFGTISTPASAVVLGIPLGGGYFMIDGKGIPAFPPGSKNPVDLPGVAVAAGIFASMIWGSKPIGLYAEVFARADLGVSFDPFFLIGRLYMRGGLYLWIVSIEVSADLELRAKPVYFRGKLHGEIDLFFFTLEGSVEIAVGGSKPGLAKFPDLIGSVYLQSFAPVLGSGQGGERPIDASLGEAVVPDAQNKLPAGAVVPVVPVDSIVVVQFACSPVVADATPTYSEPLKPAPGLTPADGRVNLGGQPLRYTLGHVKLLRRNRGSDATLTDLAGYAAVPGYTPPAVWRARKNLRNDRADPSLELALGSRTPSAISRALERSEELTTTVTETWEGLCTPVAPPVRVLWTLCNEKIGPAKPSWTRLGVAWPDPPNTKREEPAPTALEIRQLALTPTEKKVLTMAQELGEAYVVGARVIGRAGQTLQQQATYACHRALQLPRLARAQAPNQPAPVKPPVYTAILADLGKRMTVTLVTGQAAQVRLLVAADRSWDKTALFELRKRDAKGKQIGAAIPLNSVGAPTVVELASFAGLPSTWRDAQGPWASQITPVWDFISTGEQQLAELDKLLITLNFSEHDPTAMLELYVRPNLEIVGRDRTLVLAAVEVLSRAELHRATYETSVQETQAQAISDYLDLGEAVPLLEPNSDYCLEVAYKVESLGETVNDSGDKVHRRFFRTDDLLPARLDPYVLGCTPEMTEDFYFHEDPLLLAFNDTAALRLFAKHGATLRFRVRGSDGAPVDPPGVDAKGDPVAQWSGDPMSAEYDLGQGIEQVPTAFDSPYYEALEQVAEALQCVNGSGAQEPMMDTLVLKTRLRPLIDYTFDLRVDPEHAHKVAKIVGADGKPMKGELPLLRRSFRTGRFADLAELAASVRKTRISHRALKSTIALPSAGATTDEQMQAALIAAGEQALAAPGETRVVVYWAPGQGGVFRPHAVLIDAVEPLWRWRSEYELVDAMAASDENYDPQFKLLRPQQRVTLKLGDSPHIDRYVHACGGARTVAFFAPASLPPPGGQPTTVLLRLERPQSALFPALLPAAQADALSLIVSAAPPWEDQEP